MSANAAVIGHKDKRRVSLHRSRIVHSITSTNVFSADRKRR
jgi:hypothetical protein